METLNAVVTVVGIWAFLATAVAVGVWLNK